jgi:putative oxidoreductase
MARGISRRAAGLFKPAAANEEDMSTTGTGTQKLIFPALGPFYSWATEIGYLLLRVAAGLMLIPHVWMKYNFGPQAVAANVMAKRGIEPALPAAYAVMAIETIGIVCITLGLFTRPVAAALVIEFLVIVKSHLASAGWGGQGGAEFPFIWLVVYIVILLRGGGPYSVDRALGSEV